MAPTAGAVCVERSADQIVLPGGVGFDGDVLPLAQAVGRSRRRDAFIDVGAMPLASETQSMMQCAALEVRLDLDQRLMLW